ncbi:hypothetical protein [Methanoplanus endosymbiosus]|uniref:Uncharacterized protein n=1 Tax=Methanoplanus endosymbiosus TaxID=33865 RepID=A0A9E7PLZ3_9EURY|nr:hypothetical protein [Methanoplanus endosymbiosus]UUX92335.1 hypothetical protein L6E24_13500 [Methanoplanus endosymbiosus]
MVWLKTLENSYVNSENILSITFDSRCNSFVAVVGYKDIRLQHKIFQDRMLDDILAGAQPRNECEIIEEMIEHIESAKKDDVNILDFSSILGY